MKKITTIAAVFALTSVCAQVQANTLEIRGHLNYGYSQSADQRIDFDGGTYLLEVEQQPAMPLVYAATSWRQYKDAVQQVTVTVYDANGEPIAVQQPLAVTALTPIANTFYVDYGRYNDFASWTLNGLTTESRNSQFKLNLQGPSTALFASTAEFPSFVSHPRYVNATLTSSLETAAGVHNLYLNGLVESISYATQDSDGDGVLDDLDRCPGSDIRATVMVGANDSGVTNSVDGAGCSIADQVKACYADANNHGDTVSCISHLATELRKAGIISGRDQGQLLRSL